MIKYLLAITAGLALPALVLAQTLTGVTVEPAQITAGESVKVTVNFDVEGGINCGLRLHFGEGPTVDYKINQKKDVPLVVPRAYGRAGDFRIMAEPKTVGTLLKCNGRNQTTLLKVAAAAPAPVASAPEAKKAAAPETKKAAAKPAEAPRKAASRCPDGWTLNKKSDDAKTGAFTCEAKPGTKVARRLSCPGDLTYFENSKKGMLGCRP